MLLNSLLCSSQTPHSQRSGSVSSKASSGSRHSSRSRSGSRKSRSGTPENRRSRSGSNVSRKSGGDDSPKSHGSESPASRKSRSRSRRSGSGSEHSDRSKSGAPQNRSRSGSNHSGSNRSGSATSANRSRSGSNASRKSQRSRSGSAVSAHRSRSGSNASRKSASPATNTNSTEKRKRAVLSDSDSNDLPATHKAKKSGLIDSDSEEEPMQTNEVKEGVTADALFGDDVDDISDDEEQAKKSGSDKDQSDREDQRKGEESDARRSKTPDRARSRSGSKSSDDQNFERVYQNLDDEKEIQPEPEPLPETRIDVEIPRIVTNLGRDIHFVKMPNFLSVETRPFDVDQYEDEIDEEDVMDEEGRQRLKLKVGNTIRWRENYDSEGKIQRESNARFVKWSDGSMSLHLGSEIFDVYKQPLAGDHNHLFIRQGTGLQGQAVFRTKLTFRPHSTESSTHKKMTMSLADRSTKTSGIKILTQVGHDPDADRYAKLKSEEEKLRQAMRARAGHAKQPKRSRDSGAGHNASYHEEASDDEGAISIAAIKGKYKKDPKSKQSASAIYSSDEDGSDIETRRKKKADKSKALRALDEEDGGSTDDNEGSEHKSGSEHSGSDSADDKTEESD